MTDAVVVPLLSAGSSIACVRSLGRRGVHTVGVGDPPFAAASRSKYCGETRAVPSPYECLTAYGDALLEIVEHPEVVTVVPLREPDAYVLATRRDEFADHVATPWVGGDTLELVRDRVKLVERAREAGVAVPETATLDEWDGWDERTVVKPRYSILHEDGGAFYAEPQFFQSDTAPGREEVAAIEREMRHSPIAQEYVPGDREHGFFALCDRGEPVVTFQHQRIRSYSYTGGASVYRKAVKFPGLERAGRRLLSALDWHGPAMVEFKHDPRDDSYKLMEVNPRFWGSLSLPYSAGVDFPRHYYELATDRLDDPDGEYAAGVGCHLLRGEVSYLASILTERYDHVDAPALLPAVWDVARSVVLDPNFDYLDVDDPSPFLHDFGGAVRDVFP